MRRPSYSTHADGQLTDPALVRRRAARLVSGILHAPSLQRLLSAVPRPPCAMHMPRPRCPEQQHYGIRHEGPEPNSIMRRQRTLRRTSRPAAPRPCAGRPGGTRRGSRRSTAARRRARTRRTRHHGSAAIPVHRRLAQHAPVQCSRPYRSTVHESKARCWPLSSSHTP